MSRRLILPSFLVAVLLPIWLLPAPALANHLPVDGTWATFLDGAQVVPGPGDPDGQGQAIVSLSPTHRKICVGLDLRNITAPTALHLHWVGPGQSVVIDLAAVLAGKTCVRAASSLLREIRRQSIQYYLEVHNADYPAGALRGTLRRAARQTYPVLSGVAGIPPAPSGGDTALQCFIVVQEPPENQVVEISVLVRITHPALGALTLTLTSPQNTSVVLSRRNGGSGDDYGTGAAGCGGAPTVFTTGGPVSVRQATAPFAGSFRSQQALTAVISEPAAGVWSLLIDNHGGPAGTLDCWAVDITRV